VNSIPPHPRLSFTRFGDIELAPRKRQLVRGMLGDGEMSCLFGPPGCGKSVLAGDLAAHIAAAMGEWMGRAIGSGPVLYLAAERADLVKRRLAAWRRHHSLSAKQAAAVPLAVVDGVIDLHSSSAVVDEIITMAATLAAGMAQDPALIVVDTLSRTMAGGDENSSADMGKLVANLHRLQIETSAHVMIIHHTPQDGAKRMRGHGALLGACDTTIAVERGHELRTATVDKANDSPEGERIAFTLESVELRRDEGDPTTAPVVVPAAIDPGTPAARTRRGGPAAHELPRSTRIAFDALQRAIETDGTAPPSNAPVRQTAKVVNLENWRRVAYEAGISSGGNEARKKAFQRAFQNLQTLGRVGSQDESVWICAD
jgi:hypothetical protein